MTVRQPMSEIAAASGVVFGTSGARGRVVDLTDRVAYAYGTAFLQYVARGGAERRVILGGDLRPSTERLLRALARAAADRGVAVEHAGRLPSPALALRGIATRTPTAMVTGSHIPDDRNGIKFTTASGEIDKRDEAGILAEAVELRAAFAADGRFADPAPELADPDPGAVAAYVARFVDAFPERALAGRRVGVYGHSSVGRDVLSTILEALGADVLRLGWSDRFVAVDTEAVRAEDLALLRGWAREHAPFAIVSCDGDADRPLFADERGEFVRGDLLGPIVARYFQASFVAAPVSCNSALERSGWFPRTERTRIGSPYVIEALARAAAAGEPAAVGFEANGGFLTATELHVPGGGALSPLLTRDPTIVHLALLVLASSRGVPVSALPGELPARFTASDRLQDFPSDAARARIAELERDPSAIARTFPDFGAIARTDAVDGLKIEFASGDSVHVRASGNAPELRCYVESESAERAARVLARALELLGAWR